MTSKVRIAGFLKKMPSSEKIKGTSRRKKAVWLARNCRFTGGGLVSEVAACEGLYSLIALSRENCLS